MAVNKDQRSLQVKGMILSIEDLASVVVEEEEEGSQTRSSKAHNRNKLD
jgi:hypothetical protein